MGVYNRAFLFVIIGYHHPLAQLHRTVICICVVLINGIEISDTLILTGTLGENFPDVYMTNGWCVVVYSALFHLLLQ